MYIPISRNYQIFRSGTSYTYSKGQVQQEYSKKKNVMHIWWNSWPGKGGQYKYPVWQQIHNASVVVFNMFVVRPWANDSIWRAKTPQVNYWNSCGLLAGCICKSDGPSCSVFFKMFYREIRVGARLPYVCKWCRMVTYFFLQKVKQNHKSIPKFDLQTDWKIVWSY